MSQPNADSYPQHGRLEIVHMEVFLPFEWDAAVAAFPSSNVPLTDIASEAVTRHVSATMDMYRTLKEARK